MNLHQWHNDILGERTVEALKKNNFDAVYFTDKKDAVEHILSFMESGAKIGVGGSATVKSLGILEKAKEKGAHILDHNVTGLSAEEKMDIRRQQLLSDVFICSTNALTLTGELVNIDGVGNRVAAMTFGPKKVIIVAGVNKICQDAHAGYERIKMIAAPINCKRLSLSNPCATVGTCMNCQTKSRSCNIYSTIKKKPASTDITVVVIGENLGF